MYAIETVHDAENNNKVNKAWSRQKPADEVHNMRNVKTGDC